MLRTMAALVSSLALVAGCQSTPKDANALVIEVGEDGQMRVVSAGDSEEDQAIAAMIQLALDLELDNADEQEPLEEDEVWSTDGAGNLTHIQSGAQCPLRWGGYVRQRTGIYQPDGTDVGCSYSSPDGNVQTFYIYKSDLSLADELEQTFETMQTRQPISEEVRFGDNAPSGGYVARALAYATADGVQMRTSVLLTDEGGWRLKIRLTCGADDVPRAETAAGIALIGQAERLASPSLPPTAKPSPI
jgi:hypothetical protein